MRSVLLPAAFAAILASPAAGQPVLRQVQPLPRLGPLPQAAITPQQRLARAEATLAAVEANVRKAERGEVVPAAALQADAASLERVKDELDSLSEMGEMESLRLQMAMDRMSRAMATISNIMKKMTETAQGITQNLK